MTPTPELMARATQAVLGIIGVDDRANTGQAVVSPATHKMAADIARAVIEVIPDHSMPLAAPVPGAGGKGDPDDWP